MTTNDGFRIECERRTVNERARLAPLDAHAYNYDVHKYMFTAAKDLINLIGYLSDSTFDEWQNELACVVSIDLMEEIVVCGYDDGAFDDPTSGQYRSFASECDEYNAIRNHLTAEELELLDSVLTNVAHSVDDENADVVPRNEFYRIIAFIESKEIKK